MVVTDYFTPPTRYLANSDFDLGSSGIALVDVPGPGGAIEHLAVASDKIGNIYVVNRDNMGKFHPTGDVIQQEIPGALGSGLFGSPTGLACWPQARGAAGKLIEMFGFINGVLVPLGASANSFGYPGTTTTVLLQRRHQRDRLGGRERPVRRAPRLPGDQSLRRAVQ